MVQERQLVRYFHVCSVLMLSVKTAIAMISLIEVQHMLLHGWGCTGNGVKAGNPATGMDGIFLKFICHINPALLLYSTLHAFAVSTCLLQHLSAIILIMLFAQSAQLQCSMIAAMQWPTGRFITSTNFCST